MLAKSSEKALVKPFCEKNFTEFLSDLKKWSAFFYLPPKYGGQASKASPEFGEDVKKKLCFLSEERLTPREVKTCGDLRHFLQKNGGEREIRRIIRYGAMSDDMANPLFVVGNYYVQTVTDLLAQQSFSFGCF